MGLLDAPALSRQATLRKPTIILFGDSRTADCNYTDATNAVSTNLSWFDWGQAHNAAGPVFDVIRNSGIAGNTTSQMQARLQSDVLAYSPSYMTLWGGTNDSWATTADVDATYARMVQMIQAAARAGIYVFLISETTSSTKGTVFASLVQYYNDLLRAYAAGNPGIEFWDFNSVFIDSTNVNGYPLGIMTRDGVHLSALGASTLGKTVVAPRLARFGTPLVQLPNSLIDTQGNNTNVRNIASNPLMTGTSGTLGSGHTGTVPTSWATSGAHAVTMSTPARSDGFGNNMQAAITASAAGSFYMTMALSTARIIPGATYVLEGAFSATAPTALYRLAFTPQIFNGGTVYSYGWGSQAQAPTGTDGITAIPSGIFRSRLFTAPTGFSYTSANITVAVNFSGAGSATVTLGRLSLKRVA